MEGGGGSERAREARAREKGESTALDRVPHSRSLLRGSPDARLTSLTLCLQMSTRPRCKFFAAPGGCKKGGQCPRARTSASENRVALSLDCPVPTFDSGKRQFVSCKTTAAHSRRTLSAGGLHLPQSLQGRFTFSATLPRSRKTASRSRRHGLRPAVKDRASRARRGRGRERCRGAAGQAPARQ